MIEKELQQYDPLQKGSVSIQTSERLLRSQPVISYYQFN